MPILGLISVFRKMFENFAFFLFLTVICFIELANCAENEENMAADLSEAIKYKMDATWAEYKEAFGKTYESGEEEKAHERAFHERKRRIEAQNGAYSRGQQGFRLGFSPLTDWTDKERQQLNGYRRKLFRDGNVNGAGGIMSKFTLDGIDLAKLPASLDWRKGNGTRKLVTPVKNQGRCGSCWAFSTVGALEAAHSKATGALIRLSEQNLLDCDIQEYGCWGGWPRMAMEFTIGEGGLNFETLYPYKGVEQNCSFSKLKPIGASKVRGYTMVGEGDEQALMAAVALNGPISVAIYASETFMEYAAGILDDPICSQVDYLNHAVLLVGYGTDAKWGDYWIVKNSWSDRWGDKGYIKMARNKNNQCGIATEALFATI